MLEKAFIVTILDAARMKVEQGDQVEPCLFLHINGQLVTHMPLVHLMSQQEKQAYFTTLGAQLRRKGQVIEQAVFLTKTRLVLATATFAVRPSQPPNRQEVIVIMGRDAANTRETLVIQPFRRAEQQKPVWEPLAMAEYDEPVEQGRQDTGILADLFVANQKR